ncbi:TrbG/VirB9 family P-type conjugative transfer protein [Helicobacter felistomachi]|uniref:TrbG/VirB9 family P-type conjugative transfer protein n=1 Tax=Helicobacter felistomachi TaxID=3040201 RepID=UPI002572A82D|nr:TrbG/VirB9 family P-type conjugative transfer protein [Helicobacter sp. NHP21005]
MLPCLCLAQVIENEDSQESPQEHTIQDLHAIQNSFFTKEHGDLDNTLFIDYKLGQMPKLRLRYAMVTTLVFSEPIAEVVLGDSVGFSTKTLGRNVLLIKPLEVGIDSNLNVIGTSGKIYAFYIFSTTFTSPKNPILNVYVSSQHFFKDKGALNQPLVTLENKLQTPTTPTRFLKIGTGGNVLLVDKSQMQRGYRVLGGKRRAWFCLWLCKVAFKAQIKPLDIFNDKHFTYFKFDSQRSGVKFPVAYKVVDGYDNPINTRIVGDYLIAEDISRKWTLREGKIHACVRKVSKTQ